MKRYLLPFVFSLFSHPLESCHFGDGFLFVIKRVISDYVEYKYLHKMNVGDEEMENLETTEIKERLEFLEFRQQLLFENTELSRFLFEMEVTKEQLNRIYDLMDALSGEIREEKLVTHSAYEQQIYEIVPAKRGNYHFAESISQILHEARRWPEVFEHVYGSMEKFKNYLNKEE